MRSQLTHKDCETLAMRFLFSGGGENALTENGFKLKDGKTFKDLSAAVSNGIKNGRGKTEYEIFEIAVNLSKILEKMV